ncbi:MAG: ribonuclease M5 [Clostridiales bacterium]|nr:ribonuclease M5 [Clostridiales bacterium]
MIREVIVVEGRDDYLAVKKAVDAEIIVTGGYSFPKDTLKRIHFANLRRGVIILTDPDYAGERIRKYISRKVPGCRHAFLPVQNAMKDGDIGVENAKPEDIIDALNRARVEAIEKRQEFTVDDLIKNGLECTPDSSKKRAKMGRILGIGYGNCKQFLSRLNNYGVTREEFNSALSKI